MVPEHASRLRGIAESDTSPIPELQLITRDVWPVSETKRLHALMTLVVNHHADIGMLCAEVRRAGLDPVRAQPHERAHMTTSDTLPSEGELPSATTSDESDEDRRSVLRSVERGV